MANKARVVAVFLVGTFICGAGVTAVFGQNGSQSKGVPHSLEEVLAMLADLGTAVAGLQQDVDHISDVLDSFPTTEVNYRVTSPIPLATGAIDCIVVNVSSGPRTVALQFINASSGIPFGSSPATATIEPGRAFVIGRGAANTQGFVYCMITVVDGTKSDIRGNVYLSPSATGGFNPTLVVPAE